LFASAIADYSGVPLRALNSTLSAMVVAGILLLWGAAARAELRVDAAFRTAAEQGDTATMQSLLAEGADADRSDALYAAIAVGQRRSIDFLLAHGADPNAWTRGRVRLPSGAEGSPVFIAAKQGDVRLIKDLKNHGADLDAQDASRGSSGETPLLYAVGCGVQSGDWSAARLLIEAGADVNHPDRSGTTALMRAVGYAHGDEGLAFVKLLLARGANPDAKDHQGQSARDLANQFGGPQMTALIERQVPGGPSVYATDKERIAMDLIYKAACDQSTPGYAQRQSAPFARWSAPRAAVIQGLEADPAFQQTRTEMLHHAAELTVTSGDSRLDADQRDQAASFRALCEKHLPDEFMGVVTEYTNAPNPPRTPAEAQMNRSLLLGGSLEPKVESVTVVQKYATPTAGGMRQAAPAAPGPNPP
jgi:hypothetical protein